LSELRKAVNEYGKDRLQTVPSFKNKSIMRYIKYFLALIAVGLLAVACSEDPEEFRQTSVVAPVLKDHGVILVTPSSKVENVTFTWNALRPGYETKVDYELFGKYGQDGADISFGSTSALSLSIGKEIFNETVLTAGAPENESFEMQFFIKAYYDNTSVSSNTIKVKVQSQGELIEPEFLGLEEGEEFILNSASWDQNLSFAWEPARLETGAEIEYAVLAYYNTHAETAGKAVPAEAIEIARTKETTLSMNQETFNEWIVKAGAPEGVQSEITLYIKAYSAEIPEGLESANVNILVTTYSVNYPEKLYVPGSHCGWDWNSVPTMPMTDVKGIYECFINLETTDGNPVEFKFTSQYEWDGTNLGKDGEITPETDEDGNLTITDYALSTDGGAGNLTLPGGIYRLVVNYKTKTFTALKIERVGLIGSATPTAWDGDTEMVYDKEANMWTLTTNLTSGGEYKIRMNNSWKYSIGDNGKFDGGKNFSFTKADGEYKVFLNTGVYPYQVKLVNTAFPDVLHVVGSHQGWSPETAPGLKGNGEGLYEGFLNLTDKDGKADCEFKFNPDLGWNENDFGGTFDASSNKGTLGGPANIAAPSGYYYIQVNIAEQTFTLTPITRTGLIGAFNSWGADEAFTYDAVSDSWTLSNVALPAGGDGFKIRFNEGWDLSLGGNPTDLTTENGSNMTVAEAGNYDLVLNIQTKPYRLTITKK